MADFKNTPPKSLQDPWTPSAAIRKDETVTDIDAVALKTCPACGKPESFVWCPNQDFSSVQACIQEAGARAKPAALASAQPAQAGEYEGLAKRLEEIAGYLTEEEWPKSAGDCAKAASAIRTLEAERRYGISHNEQLHATKETLKVVSASYQAAEARALAAEQRLSALSQPETVRVAVEALEECEVGWSNAIEAGLLPKQHIRSATIIRDNARKALASLRERPTDGGLKPETPNG